MHQENELPPSPIPLDDTPVPPAVAEQVEALQASGKRVNMRLSRTDYAKLMQMPHADRLAFALEIAAMRETRSAAKRITDRQAAVARRQRKRKRQQRRQGRK